MSLPGAESTTGSTPIPNVTLFRRLTKTKCPEYSSAASSVPEQSVQRPIVFGRVFPVFGPAIPVQKSKEDVNKIHR